MRVWSSTQSMDAVQAAVARVLALPAHRVNVGAPLLAAAAWCLTSPHDSSIYLHVPLGCSLIK
jgi:hypothetical protein